MSDPTPKKPEDRPASLADQIGRKAERKISAKNHPTPVWFGLGMMGLIGWSISVPTLIGAALGGWIDRNHPGPISWSLSLIVAGLLAGCLNAWYWVEKETHAMEQNRDNGHE